MNICVNSLAACRLAILCTVLFTSSYSLAEDATALLARHDALRGELANNSFGRPLYMESSQKSSHLAGEVYAQIAQPFAVAGAALKEAADWCDILILHLNIKSCRAGGSPAVGNNGDTLRLHIGRKTDMPLTSAKPIDFNYTVTKNTSDYLQVKLEAKEGPQGTSNYRIELEAIPLDASSSFIHLSYSYNYGVTAEVAMKGYLATIGSNKVGFSIAGHDAEGRPKYTDGMRGVIERNTMRYYLAIEAYLGSLATPASQQVDKRLNDWFTSTEGYALQLHEIERQEYLAMKHDEIQRQSAPEKVQ